jgi:hypothetical protein
MSSGKSYDQPLVISYSLGLQDIGAAGDLSSIAIPFGKTRFRVEDINISAVGGEDFDTGGKIQLGIIGNTDRYAELDIGVLVDTDSLGITDPDASLFDIGHGGKGVVDVTEEAISQIEVTIVTSTSTGIGYPTVVIGWW